MNYFCWYKFSWVENKYYFHGFDVVCMPAFRTITFDSHIPTKIGTPQVITNTIHIPVVCVNASDFNCSLRISLCIFSKYYRMELLDKLWKPSIARKPLLYSDSLKPLFLMGPPYLNCTNSGLKRTYISFVLLDKFFIAILDNYHDK